MNMIVKPLALQEQVKFGANTLIKITYADIVAAGGANLTLTAALLSCAANTMVRRVKARVVTAFAGCAALQIEVGDGSGVARNLAAFDLKSTAGTWKTLNPTTTTENNYTVADTLDALFTATTNNLDQLSAGELWLLIDTVNLNELTL